MRKGNGQNLMLPPLNPADWGPRGGRGAMTVFEKPESIVFEKDAAQGGFDLWFRSKQTPALLAGRVKDISSEPGYGNYVVIEARSPTSGKLVDVLISHLDETYVQVGQTVTPITVVGRQGGTGNVRSADGTISSYDFLAPAPRGSKSMDLYQGREKLKNYLVEQLEGRAPVQAAGGGQSVGSRGVPKAAEGYLRSIAELESDNRPGAVNPQQAGLGGNAAGRFQFIPSTLKWAENLGINPKDLMSSNESRQYPAVLEFIRQTKPSAYDAILAGDYGRADILLNQTWTSLPGGREQAKPERMTRAMRFRR
jgi:hypothetical protein